MFPWDRIQKKRADRRIGELGRREFLWASASVACLAEIPLDDGMPAFDGAMGWAARTPGGRGGRIVRVSTLAGEGAGSLRAALAERGPRTIVFEVGGVIDLARRDLQLTEPYVTVAGQTAPEPGITIIRGGLHVRTHDVVIRHLRIRPGVDGAPPHSGWNVDGLTCLEAVNVVVDQCSFSWATDENLSASGPRFAGGETAEDWRTHTSRKITFSRNIVAEGLSNASHTKGEHSKGTLIHDNVSEVLITGNIYAHNFERNQLFKGGVHAVSANNLIYDPGNKCMNYAQLPKEWEARPRSPGRLAIVGNVVRGGPSTRDDLPFLTLQGDGGLDLYLDDNVAVFQNGTPMTMSGRDLGALTVLNPVSLESLAPPQFRPKPAGQTVAWVMEEAGARPWARDAVDRRILAQFSEGAGRIIDDEREVGGYPAPAPTSAAFRESDWDLNQMILRPVL